MSKIQGADPKLGVATPRHPITGAPLYPERKKQKPVAKREKTDHERDVELWDLLRLKHGPCPCGMEDVLLDSRGFCSACRVNDQPKRLKEARL